MRGRQAVFRHDEDEALSYSSLEVYKVVEPKTQPELSKHPTLSGKSILTPSLPGLNDIYVGSRFSVHVAIKTR